ncbi:MAG TPA: MarR family transcriptional regulator [Terriglobus sp.]|jgi:DNA-binding MarR family transcriptional regulator
MVSNAVSQRFAQRLAETGVTVSEWVVLRAMYGQEKLAPSAVAETLGMTRGAISKLVDRLEGKRLVSRKGSEHDGRALDIALTATGKQLVPELARLADENDATFFDSLNAVERDRLLATLRALASQHGLHSAPTS